jgi:hypothetical protein
VAQARHVPQHVGKGAGVSRKVAPRSQARIRQQVYAALACRDAAVVMELLSWYIEQGRQPQQHDSERDLLADHKQRHRTLALRYNSARDHINVTTTAHHCSSTNAAHESL